jgi:dolichol-phosphate mannosyltransferase
MPDTHAAPPRGLAVVIPVYNEGDSARRCVDAVLAQLSQLGMRTALLVVDDGSLDRTVDALATVRAPPSVVFEVLQHPMNRGYGAALRTGAGRAARLGLEWVLFMDSDLTNPPEHIKRFAERMTEEVDYLKGSRYGPEASVEGVPAARRFLSRAGNAFARTLSGSPFSDTTNGFRAIRTRAFLDLPLQETGFPIIMEELYWAQRHGLRCGNVPTTLLTRTTEQRSSVFGYAPGVLLRYAKYPVYGAAARLRSAKAESHAKGRREQ